MDEINNEVLFVGTAEAEHLEMYLKAIWHIKESGGKQRLAVLQKDSTYANLVLSKCSKNCASESLSSITNLVYVLPTRVNR